MFNFTTSRGGEGQSTLQLLVESLERPLSIPIQCPKLKVHTAPGVHISTAGCTILGGVHPVCARFLSHLLLLYIGRVPGAISGCTVLWEVHPASAQNKSLISDTAIHLHVFSEEGGGAGISLLLMNFS